MIGLPVFLYLLQPLHCRRAFRGLAWLLPRLHPSGPSGHHSLGVKYADTSASLPDWLRHWNPCRLSDVNSCIAALCNVEML